jgi:RNA polymerase sigma factor (TIGR02999 family)
METADGAGDGRSAAVLGELIDAAEQLDGRCPAELFGLLYRELHQLAQRQLRRADVTLGTTTLLHEAYLGLSGRAPRFPDRSRFLAYAARAMRGLIIDHARAQRALKRGGEFHLTGLDTGAAQVPAEELSRVAEAIDALGVSDPRLAELVDLKFFCGFSVHEIAAMRGSSERTVERDWVKARLYLHRQLGR